MQVTLGGDRIGSGNKQKLHLHNYYRSTHDLSKKFTSSMAAGVLYPCYVTPAAPGDTFDIDLQTIVRTIPTIGPLFGSFKLQADYFICPVRLYQGILHNNPVEIGLQMNQVLLPKIRVRGNINNAVEQLSVDYEEGICSTSSLLKYCGVSGTYTPLDAQPHTQRDFNAIPILAYYDIFKNYYANKQENNAYVIAPNITSEDVSELTRIEYNNTEYDGEDDITFVNTLFSETPVEIFGERLNINNLSMTIVYGDESQYEITDDLGTMRDNGYIIISEEKKNKIKFYFDFKTQILPNKVQFSIDISDAEKDELSYSKTPKLMSFALKNIDEMRYRLLAHNELGTRILIGEDNNEEKLPYLAVTSESDVLKISYNAFPLNGLCVKTYQSDLFNNWVKTDWITGANGILAITSISTSGGSFNLDTLNLAEKIYNMLNRVAVGDGSYQGWQEAIWAEHVQRHAETPMYVGGMSAEIGFEEIISTAETLTDGETNALGTLGGRGKQFNEKGGHLTFKVTEPSFIIGIISLTPRLTYSQGNKWFMTEMESLDDWHKPALDGIGFQSLITEQMLWTETFMSSQTHQIARYSAGKVPAWINWMTDIDECYGDFASKKGKAFMALNRNYERITSGANKGRIKDLTTYIDPSKYNYAFAYTELTAQNFWVQLGQKVIARRKMSAKIIPNL